MRFVRDQLLKARNALVLMVGIIARISGCASQREISLEDQTEHLKAFLAEIYDGPVKFVIIATKGKGECLTRVELAEIEARLKKKEFDLVLMEDLGRLIRGAEVVRLLGVAVDNGTRVIAPGDSVDTANHTWEADAIQAAADHVAHQQHTSRRIKSRLKVRFLRNGLTAARPIPGYIVPEGATSYDDWQKDNSATPWIREGYLFLKSTLNASATADFLNEKNIPVGPGCRTRVKWDGQYVREFYSNPLLKGIARRNTKISTKIYGTGKRQSVKNEEGPIFYECPHLAHLTPLEFDELNDMLELQNADFGRKPIAGHDPRYRMPRKRTRFPGQHVICWHCGHRYVWGGNGVAANLMCDNSRDWQCWNSIGFNGELAAKRIMEAITSALYKLPEFEPQFQDILERADRNNPSKIALRREKLGKDQAAWEREKHHVTEAMRKHGEELFANQMADLKSEKLRIDRERNKLQQPCEGELQLPSSLAELREMVEREFVGAAWDSPEFGNLLRKLCPEFHVYLVRLCDGGHPVPRARIRLALDGMLDDAIHVPGLGALLSQVMTIDMFEPVQRERIREEAVKLAATGLHPRQIAPLIAEQPTFPAVQKAINLHKKMLELGLSSPYVLLTAPPEDYAKLRRHQNPKYVFRPRPGYQPPELY